MPLRIAIQGELGSNSHLAVQQMLGEQELVPCSISAEVFEKLSSEGADAAILPIENSLHGAVADHYDLLLEHDVKIMAEMQLRIRHALIAAPGVSLQDVRRVLSHPVALSQCRRFFRSHPSIQAVPFYDTAGSVKEVVASNLRDTAAIAAPYAADVYSGNVLVQDLEDDAQNFTRFLLLCRKPDLSAAGSLRIAVSAETKKLSLAFAIPHQPGSLVSVLQLLAGCGADLTRIESRPVPGQPWQYIFFIDMRLPASITETAVVEAIQPGCSMVRSLGLYPSVLSPSA